MNSILCRSVKIQTLGAGLSPSYLRIGGTDADFVIFTGMELNTDENIWKFDPVNFTMSGNKSKKYAKETAIFQFLFQFSLMRFYKMS